MSSDHNLLFGILALQLDFIDRDQLVAAMNAWVLAKDRPLGALLVDQGALEPQRHQLLDALVVEHLRRHDGDPRKSLAAVSSIKSVRKDLEEIADPDLGASLVHVSRDRPHQDPDGTLDQSVGVSTTGLRFRILRPHARGGLGEVHIALDEELQREVALKLIKDKHADYPESRMRFLVEGEITGRLEHPGIVPVYGLGQFPDGRPFYAMRFVRGDSLKRAIDDFHRPGDSSSPQCGENPVGKGKNASDRNLRFRQLLRRFQDVCNAIQYAHDRGVLHRDIKPGNIMLGRYGETLVVDWGLAKAGISPDPGASRNFNQGTNHEPPLDPARLSGSSETVAGEAMGTPQYMSPEQAEGRLDLLGPASDVYSLGATLYHLLTGKPAVEGEDTAEVLERVRRGEILRPRRVKGEISPALEAVCLKALALDPEARYASPSALAEDVEHWLADEPVSAWPEPWMVRTRRWVGKHRTLVTTAAAVIIVGAVSLMFGLIVLGNINQELESAYQDAKNKERLMEQEKEKAERSAKQALKALRLFRSLLEELEESQGRLILLENAKLESSETDGVQAKEFFSLLKAKKNYLAEIHVFADPGKFRPVLSVVDPDGRSIEGLPENGIAGRTKSLIKAEKTGNYRFVVAGPDSIPGDFILRIREIPETAKASLLIFREGLRILEDLTQKDPLDPLRPKSRTKAYEVLLPPGKHRIELKSKEFDPFLRVENMEGKIVAVDDDSGGALNSRLTLSVPVEQRYRIVVTSFSPGQTGKFELQVTKE